MHHQHVAHHHTAHRRHSRPRVHRSTSTGSTQAESPLEQSIPGAFPERNTQQDNATGSGQSSPAPKSGFRAASNPPARGDATRLEHHDHVPAHVPPNFDKAENMPSTEHPFGSSIGIGSMPGSNREAGVATLPEEHAGGKPYGQGHTGFEPYLIPPNHQKGHKEARDHDEAPIQGPVDRSRAEDKILPEKRTSMSEPLFPKIKDLPPALDAPAMEALAASNPIQYRVSHPTTNTGEEALRAQYLHETNPVQPGSLPKHDQVYDRIPESSIFSATQRLGVQPAAPVPPLPSLFTKTETLPPSRAQPQAQPQAQTQATQSRDEDSQPNQNQNQRTQRRPSLSDAARAAWHNVEGVVENAVHNAEKAWESVNEYVHGHLPPPIMMATSGSQSPATSQMDHATAGDRDRDREHVGLPTTMSPGSASSTPSISKSPSAAPTSSPITMTGRKDPNSFTTSAHDFPRSIPSFTSPDTKDKQIDTEKEADTEALARKMTKEMKFAGHPDELPADVKGEYFRCVIRSVEETGQDEETLPAMSVPGVDEEGGHKAPHVHGPTIASGNDKSDNVSPSSSLGSSSLAHPQRHTYAHPHPHPHRHPHARPGQGGGAEGRKKRHEVEFDLDGERFDASQWLYDSDLSDASFVVEKDSSVSVNDQGPGTTSGAGGGAEARGGLGGLGLDWKSDKAREGWAGSSDTPIVQQPSQPTGSGKGPGLLDRHSGHPTGGGGSGTGVSKIPRISRPGTGDATGIVETDFGQPQPQPQQTQSQMEQQSQRLKKLLGHSNLRKAYISAEDDNAGQDEEEGSGVRLEELNRERVREEERELQVQDGMGVGTGFGGVGYYKGYTHGPAATEEGQERGTEMGKEAGQGGRSILPGYPTEEGMKTLIAGRMAADIERGQQGGRSSSDSGPQQLAPSEERQGTSGLSKLAPIKARAGIPHLQPKVLLGENGKEDIARSEERLARAQAGHAAPRKMEEKREIPVFLSGEDTASGRFEAIFEPVTGQPSEIDTQPEFQDKRSHVAGAAEGKFDARMMPKQPTFKAMTKDPNVEQLVPMGDLDVGMTSGSVPVPESSLPLMPGGGNATTTSRSKNPFLARRERDERPERQSSRDSNTAERGSFSDLDLGLDSPTPTPDSQHQPAAAAATVREQSRIPVFRSGANTASGPYEARFETVTGQPKEVDESPVFKTGTEAPEGRYEATMTPSGFPPPPRRSSLKRQSGNGGQVPPPLPPRPMKASVVDATMLPDDDEMSRSTGDIGEQPNPLAHRAPRELHEVPIFESGDTAATGHYEASFATVTGNSQEVDVEPVFVGTSKGQDAAEGDYEAKMEPEVFHKRRASISSGGKSGLAYLGKPVAPTQEAEAAQTHRAPRRSIN